MPPKTYVKDKIKNKPHIEWSSIKITVPNEMIHINAKGQMIIKPTLTKSKGITKIDDKPSIQLDTSTEPKVIVESDGKLINEEEAVQKKKTEKNVYVLSGKQKEDKIVKQTKTFKRKLNTLLDDELKMKKLNRNTPMPLTDKKKMLGELTREVERKNQSRQDWIDFVKSIAKRENITYSQALKVASQERNK